MAEELILIVEDDERNRKLVRDILQFAGYRILEAETAEEGIELAHAQQPALVLMDIQLPGMDGIAALGRLRRDPATREIPVVAVTASVMPSDRRQILAAGFDAYQTKPISLKEFTEVVRSVIDAGPRGATAEADAPVGGKS